MRKLILLCALAVCVCAGLPAQQRADALAMYRAKRYDEGIEICKREIAANPRSIESYVVLCWCLNSVRKYQEAENYANRAREFDPKDTRLIEALAESKYYLGKNAAALEMFQLYVSTAPTSAGDYGWAYYYMGEIYVRQARYEHADIAYSMAVRVDPVKALFWTRCGYAREMSGAYESSLVAYNKAIELDSHQTDAARGKERVTPKIR